MIGFILNIPYTVIGLIVAIMSIPMHVSFVKNPYAIVITVKDFWWECGYIKRARAMAIGHVILLGPKLEEKDLEHELVHVEQYQRAPLAHPFLYYYEHFKNGYRNNKYEKEAYERAKNVYKGIEKLK